MSSERADELGDRLVKARGPQWLARRVERIAHGINVEKMQPFAQLSKRERKKAKKTIEHTTNAQQQLS
jgi:hypothetical protein